MIHDVQYTRIYFTYFKHLTRNWSWEASSVIAVSTFVPHWPISDGGLSLACPHMLHPLRSPFHQIGTEKGPLKENLFSAKIRPPRLSAIRNAAPFAPERRGKPFLPDQHQIRSPWESACAHCAQELPSEPPRWPWLPGSHVYELSKAHKKAFIMDPHDSCQQLPLLPPWDLAKTEARGRARAQATGGTGELGSSTHRGRDLVPWYSESSWGQPSPSHC